MQLHTVSSHVIKCLPVLLSDVYIIGREGLQPFNSSRSSFPGHEDLCQSSHTAACSSALLSCITL